MKLGALAAVVAMRMWVCGAPAPDNSIDVPNPIIRPGGGLDARVNPPVDPDATVVRDVNEPPPFDVPVWGPPVCMASPEVDRDHDGYVTCREMMDWLNQGWPQWDPRGYCLPCHEFDVFCDGPFPQLACMGIPPRDRSISWAAMCDRQTRRYTFDFFQIVWCGNEAGVRD